LAAKLAEAKEMIRDFRVGFSRPLLLVGAVFVLTMLQPNFSMASLMFFTAIVMMYAAGTQVKHLLLIAAVGIPGAIILAITSSYRLKRVLAFMDPTGHTGSSYQQTQSLISLGNGGMFGTGLGQGTQKLGYLPMPFTDTIYAILGEEMGFVGTTLVLGLFLVVLWRGFTIARHAQSRFGRNIAVALSTALGVTVVIHIGVCTRLLPATGQPLPLVSFGGSSLVMTLFAMGVLLNVSNPDTGHEIKESPGGLA
jgi:cell division protein FtsW